MIAYEDLPRNVQIAIDFKERCEKARELAKTDNVSVGDFSGLKCSFRDKGDVREINSYMELYGAED